ncbi:MAG: hypothetical protein U0L20_03845 [Ruminococcus sp.]|nr:hypothetical protein [Ruminococcus sp.]
MSISENKKSKEQYPIELPTRNNEIKRSPIVDVAENEIFPRKSGLSSNNFDSMTDYNKIIAEDE